MTQWPKPSDVIKEFVFKDKGKNKDMELEDEDKDNDLKKQQSQGRRQWQGLKSRGQVLENISLPKPLKITVFDHPPLSDENLCAWRYTKFLSMTVYFIYVFTLLSPTAKHKSSQADEENRF